MEWIKKSNRLPDVTEVDIKLKDGSVINRTWAQSDGDYYWRGGGFEAFIFEDVVTHWKPSPPEEDK